ncbi:MAG: hypothetical protein CL840_08225 [Crocinitomicaceae bacterium]|nr:hypothetical protein [Crocinitomicaceae bacterium]|tara:strand:- start:28278 stop:28736 length:459 start_codon:yes stop_codon:yes gene_type:complete
MKKYRTENLTIGWEPDKCIHSAVCISQLASVFDINKRPWINVDGASEEEIAKQIDRCPSGALSYQKRNEATQNEKKVAVAGTSPALVELESDKKQAWCACGSSGNQPWCDGSHKGSGVTPVVFSVDEKKKVALCMCKHTSNPPYCDGTHAKI